MEEIWKDIEFYEGLYQISNKGRVKSLEYKGIKREKILNPCKNKRGYLIVNLYKLQKVKSASVHRIVAKNFIPNKDNKTQVNHIDGMKCNNWIDNLEWNTSSENVNHFFSSDLSISFRLKISKRQSIPVIDTKTNIIYQSIKEASRINNMSESSLSRILNHIHPNKTTLKHYIKVDNE
jgi:hypothetical protein